MKRWVPVVLKPVFVLWFFLLLAGPAGATEAAIRLSVGDSHLILSPGDVKRASLVIWGDKSDVTLCLSDEKTVAVKRFSLSHHGMPIAVSIAGMSFGSTRFASVPEIRCVVMTGLYSDDAAWIQRIMTGSKKAWDEIHNRQDPNRQCPERDFIDICLRAFTDMDAIERWAKQNGWQWHGHQSVDETRLASAELERRGVFYVSEVRFSDVAEMRCRYQRPLDKPNDTPPVCDTRFPLLQEIIPNQGDRSRTSGDRPIWHQWVYAKDNWRIYVHVLSDKLGKSTGYDAIKIKYLDSP